MANDAGIQVFARRVSDEGRRQSGVGRTDIFGCAMLAHGLKARLQEEVSKHGR